MIILSLTEPTGAILQTYNSRPCPTISGKTVCTTTLTIRDDGDAGSIVFLDQIGQNLTLSNPPPYSMPESTGDVSTTPSGGAKITQQLSALDGAEEEDVLQVLRRRPRPRRKQLWRRRERPDAQEEPPPCRRRDVVQHHAPARQVLPPHAAGPPDASPPHRPAKRDNQSGRRTYGGTTPSRLRSKSPKSTRRTGSCRATAPSVKRQRAAGQRQLGTTPMSFHARRLSTSRRQRSIFELVDGTVVVFLA